MVRIPPRPPTFHRSVATVLERVRDVVVNENGDNRKPGITWGQRIGQPECPYLRRWVFNFYPAGSIRVHHWTGSDDPRALHDHPWWFLTFVMAGGYTDVSEPRDHMNTPGICPWCGGSGTDSAYDDELLCVPCDGTGRYRVYDDLRAGSVRLRPALHAHTVQVHPGGCWTIMLTGRHSRDWGFWVGTEWKRMRRYFKEHGHHHCD